VSRTLCLIAAVAGAVLVGAPAGAAAATTCPDGPVQLRDAGGGWQVVADGSPLFVEGLGYDYAGPGFDWSAPTYDSGGWFSYIDPDIGASGANVIRTYGVPRASAFPPGDAASQAETIGKMLASAERASTPGRKVWVLAGIYAQGFDSSTTQGDVTAIANAVAGDPKFDHLLGWVVGYEVDPSLFGYLDALMGALKATMTTPALCRPVMHATWSVSGTDTGRVSALQSMGNLDWLGIDAYWGHFGSTTPRDSGLSTAAQDLHSAGWTGPWLVSEFFTYDWGSAVDPGMGTTLNGGVDYLFEANSTAKAADYANNWMRFIASDAARNLGSTGGIAIKWGPPHNSQLPGFWEQFYAYAGRQQYYVNPPWTGGTSFLRLAATDATAGIYGGNVPANPPPAIVLGGDGDPQGIDAAFKEGPGDQPAPVAPAQALTAQVRVRDPGPLTFRWYLVGGSPGLGGAATQILQPGTNPQAYGQATAAQVGGSDADLPGTPSQTTANGVTTGTISLRIPTPVEPGNNYQLRVVVADAAGGAATAAVAFEMTETSAALASPRARVQRRGRVRVALGCHHARRCSGRIQVWERSKGKAGRPRRLAAGPFALPRGTASVAVPLTRHGRRRLRGGARVRATAHLKTPHAGRIRRERQPLTLIGARRAGRRCRGVGLAGGQLGRVAGRCASGRDQPSGRRPAAVGVGPPSPLPARAASRSGASR
jgi:hypothetical protein